MRYTRLGRSGLSVSRIGLGCMTYGDPARGDHPWTLPEEAGRPLIRQAVDLGINFFDMGVIETLMGFEMEAYQQIGAALPAA